MWSTYVSLRAATTVGQSGLGDNDNEEVLYIPKISMTG